MNDLSKLVGSDLASTTKVSSTAGYENDRDKISQDDLTIESSMPKGPAPDPFKLGPLKTGE